MFSRFLFRSKSVGDLCDGLEPDGRLPTAGKLAEWQGRVLELDRRELWLRRVVRAELKHVELRGGQVIYHL